jgi:hypothetical protein
MSDQILFDSISYLLGCIEFKEKGITVIKFRNLLSNIIKVKPQRGIIAYLHRLEENDYFKLKSKDLNITSEIESNKLELLKILKDFSEDLIYLDIHKKRRLENSLFSLEEYIKVSENTMKIIKNRLLMFSFFFLGCIFVFILKHRSYVLPFFFFYIISCIIVLLFLLFFVYLSVYWLERFYNYRSISFALNRLSNKIISRNDYICWDDYIERMCEIPKNLIKDVDSILSYELREVEREFDASLELVYVVAAVGGFVVFSWIGKFYQATLALIGLGVLIAILSALYRYFTRKSKNFRINCLEQLLLLLRLVQNKLDSKN